MNTITLTLSVEEAAVVRVGLKLLAQQAELQLRFGDAEKLEEVRSVAAGLDETLAKLMAMMAGAG